MLMLIACRASDVGVVIPMGGPDAMRQEDLKRDSWKIHLRETKEAKWLWLSRRLLEMNMVNASDKHDGNLCFQTARNPVQNIQFPFSEDDESALRGAIAITLAKGMDHPEQQCAVRFCFEQFSSTSPTITFAQISGGQLEINNGLVHSPLPAKSLSEVDYRMLKRSLQSLLPEFCGNASP